MKCKNFSLWFMGLILSLCSLSSNAQAITASIKSLGMAATAVAYPQDSLCAAYNPAGIVWVGNRLDLEGGFLFDKGHVRISGNPDPSHLGVNGKFNAMRTRYTYYENFGVAKTFCGDCWDWAIALVQYNRQYQKTTFNHKQPLFGTSHAGLEFLDEVVAPVLAFRFWDCHSIGISLDWHIERLKVNGLQNFANPVASKHPHDVTNRGYSYAHGVTTTIGYRGQITDCIAIGFAYAPKGYVSRFRKYIGFLAGGRVEIPERYTAGVAFTVTPCLTVAFDWEQLRWQHVRALHNPLLPNLYEAQLGDKNGPGFGFKAQNFYRLGVEYRWNECLTLRAGYRHGNTPIRPSQTAVNSLTDDCVEDFILCGATWMINPCNELSFFYAYGFEHSINGKKAIPVVPFGGGDVKLTEQKNAVGFAWGWYY